MLRDTKFISLVDLRSVFWQFPLDDSSKEITAFTVPAKGLLQFSMLPFGLSNAGQIQQRLKVAVFDPELESNIFVHLGGIIIVSSTFDPTH